MGLFSFLGGKKPTNQASPILQNAPRYGIENYDQYKRTGRGAEDILGGQARGLVGQQPNFDVNSGQYGQMANNPGNYLNNIYSGYSESPGYQYQKNQLLKDAGNTAAAGGYAGTEEDVKNRTSLVQALLSGDIQQYLQNYLGIQGQGLAGRERAEIGKAGQYGQGLDILENQAGRGYHAASSLADYLGGNAGAQAGLAYQGQAGQNANRTALLSSLMQALGQAGGSYYGYQALAPNGPGPNKPSSADLNKMPHHNAIPGLPTY